MRKQLTAKEIEAQFAAMESQPRTARKPLVQSAAESAALLAAIEAETAEFIANADTSKVGVESTYVNEWGQTMTTSSGRWLAELA